jgi:Uma2 family endonuclease
MAVTTRDSQPVHYPSEDDVAESVLHLLIRTLLLTLVRRWLAERGVRAFVGSEQFIYWVEGSPQRTVAPDLYVIPGVDPNRVFGSWKVWEEGLVPTLCVEIVSEGDTYKDYVLAPQRYGDMGIHELVIFDPESWRSTERVRWQIYRRHGDDLVLVHRHDGDAVESEVLGCWLVCAEESGTSRVRLGTGPSGEVLFPTAEEAEEALRIELDALRRRLNPSG